MSSPTQDQQKVASELYDLVMQRVFTKIAPILTEEDMQKIEELSKKDSSGYSVKYYLTSKVPNFEKLIEEETETLNFVLQ